MAKWYIIVFLLAPVAWSSAQWENISWQTEIGSAPVRVGDALFVRTAPNYYYRSRDEGKSWQLFTRGLGPHNVAYGGFVTDGIYLYSYGGSPAWQDAFGSGMFRAHYTDDEWTFIPNGAIASGNPQGFISLSRDSIFRWESGLGKTTLFFTTNRGEWWEERSTGLTAPVRIVSAHRMAGRIVINPDLLIPEDRQSLLLNGVYYTTDFGEHWQQGGIRHPGYLPPLISNKMHIQFADDSILFVQTENYYTGYDLLRSIDQGLTFDTIQYPVKINSLYSNYSDYTFVRNRPYIYMLGRFEKNIYRSTDLGTSWTPMPLTDTSDAYISSIVPLGDSILAWVDGVGYYKYSADLRNGYKYDLGTVRAYNGDLKLAVGASVIAGSDALFATPLQNSIHLSKDHGSTWSAIVVDSPLTIFDGKWTELDGVIYGTGRNAQGPALYTSLDTGATWQLLRTFQHRANLRTVTAHGDKILLSGGAFYFFASDTLYYYSSDRGNSWDTTISQRFPFRADSGKLYLAGSDLVAVQWREGKVFRSEDGNSWTDITYNIPDSLLIYGVTKIGERLVVFSKAVNYSDKITRPSNYILDPHSTEWQPSVGNLCLGCEIISVVPKEEKLYAVVKNYRTLPPLKSGAFIYVSWDSGITWTPFADGMINARGIVVGSEYIYHDYEMTLMPKGGSIYRLSLAKADVATPEVEKNLEITNIIRNGSGLEFQLTAPSNSTASIRLFDVLGRLLYEQHDAVREGKQGVFLSYPSIRSGTYIIEVSIPGATTIRYYNAIH